MYCSKCGKKISEGSLYCNACGSEISNIDKKDTENISDGNQGFADDLDSDNLQNTEVIKNEPNGIGGWLILIIVGQLWTIFQGLKTSIEYIRLRNMDVFSHLMNINYETYTSSFVILYWTELIGTLLITTLSVCILIAMFRKMKIFRRLMFTFFIFNCLLFFSCAAITSTMPEWISGGEVSSLVASYIGSGIGHMVGFSIWAIYLLKSKRVKNTFGY